MPVDALIAAPLIVAAVLVASAVGKLRNPWRSALAFDALEVPGFLARPWMRVAHPWMELLLAVCLLVTSGVPAVVTAAAVTLLLLAYALLIVRVVRRPEPPDCACFGMAGAEQVSALTVVRNLWLLVLAGVGVGVALDGRSPVEWALDAGPDLWWLAAVAAGAVTTGLILFTPSSVRISSSNPDEGLDLEDYERTETPHVPVTLSDGHVVSLRQLATERPKLVLAVSTTCGSCQATMAEAPEWQRRLPAVDVHLLYATDVVPTPDASGLEALYDPKRYVSEALGLLGTPSAVLLGVDGMLAGGPVAGHGAISAFVADIEAEFAVQHALSTSS